MNDAKSQTPLTAAALREMGQSLHELAARYETVAQTMDAAGIEFIFARGIGTFPVTLERVAGNANSIDKALRDAKNALRLKAIDSVQPTHQSTKPSPTRRVTPRKPSPAEIAEEEVKRAHEEFLKGPHGPGKREVKNPKRKRG